MKSGILVLYKDAGMTSHDAVNKVRKLFGTKKVGHTGTLDPQAVGILPILIGNAVKASEYITGGRKKYRAEITFGIFTDTEDIWGNTLEISDERPQREAFEEKLSSFIGEYMQLPPMMSAVKIGGKKLYELQREGKIIERERRLCHIYSAKLLSFSRDKALIEAECSKGTYIRTFIFDLMQALGMKGCMSSLERLESAGFEKDDSITLAELEKLSSDERENLLFPIEKYFEKLRRIDLDDFFYHLIKNGCRVDIKKMKLCASENEMLRLYYGGKFFGLGMVISEEEKEVLKKIKEFN